MRRSVRTTGIIRWLPLFFGIVVAICVAVIFMCNNRIPGWVKWQERADMPITVVDNVDNYVTSGDLKEKNSGKDNSLYTLSLSSKQFFVKDKAGTMLFSSDKAIKVQDVLLSDLDMDGNDEIVALVWKKGIYGKHRPFWIKQDEKNYSQHIFIYGCNSKGEVSQKWFASDTGVKVNRMKTLEQKREILLIEDTDKVCTLWHWDSWGLTKMENGVKFVAFGDNIIHDAIYEYARINTGNNYDFLYEPFLDDIQSADVAALNAETVLVDKESAISGYPEFGSPMEVGEAIQKAGFDVVSCANNHVLDKGIYGLESTLSFYRERGITCLGIQDTGETDYRPYEIIRKKGIRFALFSYTYGTNKGDISGDYPNVVHYLPHNTDEEKKLVKDLKKARSEADFVIVFVHWGEEYSKEISNEQEKMAALLAEGGADVVIGSHPHVVQEVETKERPDGGQMLVYYSLGNFRADQGRDEDTKKGAEAVFTVGYKYDEIGILEHQVKEINSYWKADK